MTKLILILGSLLIGIYVMICALLYFNQEQLIFFPEKLNRNFTFSFEQPFEEKNIKTRNGSVMNGVLFKTAQSKGVIFYLHGNAGALNTWGEVAKTYTDLNYDVFMLDYPGYGKSEGKINGEAKLYEDIQTAYDELKRQYNENHIVVLGYSLGTGPAANLAANNHPGLLILQAPYYSLVDMMRNTYSFVPTVLLKYKFSTNEYLKRCKMPVVLFHGNRDEVIPYASSLKLREVMKSSDTLITLQGQGHNAIAENTDYRMALRRILQ